MRNNELRFPDDLPDREIGDALRPLVAGPAAGSSYWDELQGRVMARVEEERGSAWSVLAGWTRPAAIAAALLLAAASLLLTRLSERDAAVAYGAVAEDLDPAAETPAAPASDNATTFHLLLDR